MGPLVTINSNMIILALALAVDLVHPAGAEEATTFVIAAASGYGIEDCLGEGGECGRVVADAWCEAHGHGAALSFGQEVGPAIPGPQPNPYFITCGK
jgi:hypothetical protein